jgi:5-methylcytosine-specific restriction endonuclease McrA
LKRAQLFIRDENRCVYCGKQFAVDELTLDHVQPRVRGGDRSEGNLVTACRACNTLKGQHRLSFFLHEHPLARENFFRYASYLWPRLLHLVADELEALDRDALSSRKLNEGP